MALEIKRESYKVSELQSEQINSAVKNTSEEKASSAQETPVSTSANEKQTKGARELATSKKADAQLQAMSVKMQLAASESSLTTFSKPANNVQQLGQSANDQGTVVGRQYAQQTDSKSQPEKQSAAESLRKEIAAALNVPEDAPIVDFTKAIVDAKQAAADKLERPNNANVAPSPDVKKPVELSDESVKHNQEIIDAALEFGRKIETNVGGQLQAKSFTEYIPGKNGEVYIREGQEMIFKGEKVKWVKYLAPGSINQLGIVEFITKGGKETVKKVSEIVKGSIGLKEGDTRDVPPDSSSPAGKMPSSWDPQPNGRYGKAGQPVSGSGQTNNNNNGDNNKDTQTSSEKSGVGRSLDGSSGGSMGFEAVSGGAGESSGGTSSGNHQVSYNNGQTWETSKNSLWKTETPPTQVTVEQEHEKKHQETQGTQHKKTESQSEKKEEKEKREAGEKPQVERPAKHEATHESTENDHGSQAAYGDYADLGVTAPATYAGSGQDKAIASSSNYEAINYSRQENADLHEGPYNFGNPLDAALNETPAGENPIVNDQNLTYTAGSSETDFNRGGIGLDSNSSLKNTGNPLHNSMNETPAGTLPGTSEAERNSD